MRCVFIYFCFEKNIFETWALLTRFLLSISSLKNPAWFARRVLIFSTSPRTEPKREKRIGQFTNETICRTRRLDTRMLVTYGHQGVMSWYSNSRKTVEPSRGPSAKILSKKIIKAFLGPVSTFGNRKQHTPFVHYVCFEKKESRSKFQTLRFLECLNEV